MVVAKYLDFFKSLNLRPVSFQVSAQATADAVIKKGDGSGAIVVNFGAQKTSLHIVHSGVVHFSTSAAVGGDSLTQAIMKALSVNQIEAEDIKRQKGVVKDKADPDTFFSMVNTLSVIKDEITKLGEYWKTHRDRYTEHKDNLDRVVVCGSEASIKGLQEYIEASSGVSTELANVWVNVASLDKYIPPISKDKSLSYATVIGLALSEFEKK
jgi:Tfp pilus assembly PilM family ATPase